MDTFWIRALSQIGIYATFALYLGAGLRRGPREWVPLVGTVLYAVVFEHFNMLRYAHVRGGYYYHPASWLFIWNDVPLYIPLAWAFIVSTSRALTDEIVVQKWAKPFCDALLALLIDLSLDVIAIRLHFWTWRGIGWNDAFFGVPADNFLGWLLVTFTFSLLTRALWDRDVWQRIFGKRHESARQEIRLLSLVQILIIPPLAYLLYLALEAAVHGGYALFHAVTLRGQFGVLAGVLVLFAIAAFIGSRPNGAASNPEAVPSGIEQIGQAEEIMAASSRWKHVRLHGPRHIFHIFALIGFFCLPLAARSRSVILLAFAVWLVELCLAWRASRSRPVS